MKWDAGLETGGRGGEIMAEIMLNDVRKPLGNYYPMEVNYEDNRTGKKLDLS